MKEKSSFRDSIDRTWIDRAVCLLIRIIFQEKGRITLSEVQSSVDLSLLPQVQTAYALSLDKEINT